MSTLNASVTEGYKLVEDSSGKVQLTPARLNLMAKPTVTVDIANKVATEDIQDYVVTVDKLAAAVTALIPAIAVTVGAEAGGTDISVAVQLKDASGDALNQVGIINVWISDTDVMACGTLPSGGAPTVVDGDTIIALASSAMGVYSTNASGLLTLTFVEAGPLTRYFRASIGSVLVKGTMTWAA